MINFSIFKIPVQVQVWFWVTLAFIGGAFKADSRQAFMELLLFMIAGFISILVHEFGHALTARSFGNRVHIVLQAFGGYASYSGPPMSRKRSFIITFAGPAVQIILGMGVFLLIMLLPKLNSNGETFLFYLAAISMVWAIFNLLPILPLDGGRLVESLLGPNRIKTTLWISVITAASVALVAALFKDYFVAIFVALFGFQSYKALQEQSWR